MRGQRGEYAFGLMHRQIERMKAIGHSGSFIGFKADYLRIPQRRFSVITLCNGEFAPAELNREVVVAISESVIDAAAP